MNIFPRGPDTWHYHNYLWRGQKMDEVFTALNNFHRNGSTPVNMAASWGNFFLNISISEDEPSVWWTFAYRGRPPKKPKISLPPSIKLSTDEISYICQKGQIRISSTAGIQIYNLTAERLIYEGFRQRILTHPELAAGSVILHEGYSTEAVGAQGPGDSAYPFRADHHLMLFSAIIPPGSLDMERAALQWSRETVDNWNAGQPERTANAYVNYAHGVAT
ncbi:hypothetical protein BDW59DRAFT_158251 [Aspergillus cavernicola]|uniref:Uncharacterized protein n=1 Tax=Aspergillus cavernicola TaxID=176166 RepID=A0ABR4ISQ7_9EURO